MYRCRNELNENRKEGIALANDKNEKQSPITVIEFEPNNVN